METLSAVKAKVGPKSAGGCEAAGAGEPQPAPSSSPAGFGSPAPPEPHAGKLEDLETLATVGTGTFGRVHLVKEKMAKRYFALKVMSIPDVIRLKQEQHVHNEKSVLKEVNHPFLIRLFWTYHDERFLYMLMEYVPGGELFSYLRNMGRFNNSTGLFYSAEIICAIEYLHSKEIVYRDLKPENILLDKEGHIKLTDFGFAKKLVDRTWTLCGTPEYLAPEVIQSKGHGRAVDWWALGILIFEMLSGFPPFFDDNPFGIYQKILAGKIDFPRHLDLYVKDLIKKLLVVDRTRRLGNMKNGADDVKRHRWFRSIDWDAVPQRKLKPPIVPKVSNDGDTSNFEAYPEDDWNKTPPFYGGNWKKIDVIFAGGRGLFLFLDTSVCFTSVVQKREQCKCDNLPFRNLAFCRGWRYFEELKRQKLQDYGTKQCLYVRSPLQKQEDKRVSDFLGTLDSHECLVQGGDFNTTLEEQDRSAAELSPATANILRGIVEHHSLVVVWCDHHPDDTSTFTFVQVEAHRSHHSRLDRIYLSHFHLSQAHSSNFRLAPFSDHHLATITASLRAERSGLAYWHFNNSMLEDEGFVTSFREFWLAWQEQRRACPSAQRWWDLGKVRAKLFCRDYTRGTSRWRNAAIEQLEREVLEMERRLAASPKDPFLCRACREKREELWAFKDHRARGAFVRSHICLLQEMDRGSRFFYALEKMRGAKKHVTCLLREDGAPLMDPVEMCGRARDFYTSLFSPNPTDPDASRVLWEELPMVSVGDQD
ncbi:unnamed protein product [Caretta caretta]